MKQIAPCLWFDTEAADAAELYTSLIENSRVTSTSHYGDAGPRPAGTVMTVGFELNGAPYVALNGGPGRRFNESLSLQVPCEDQAEVDRLWHGLTADGGEESQCGWLKDRYGVSWQIIPTALGEMLADPDPGRSQAAMQAMLGMTKIDIAALRRAQEQA